MLYQDIQVTLGYVRLGLVRSC